MRNAAKEDVVKLIEYGRTLPHCTGAGELFASLLAAAIEIAVQYEPNRAETIAQITKAVHIVYDIRRKAGN